MKNKILIMFGISILILLVSVSAYYELDMQFSKTDDGMAISLNSFKDVPYQNPFVNDINQGGNYSFNIQVSNSYEKIVYNKLIYVPFYVFDVGEVNDTDLFFTLPRLKNVTTVKIFYKGFEDFSWDIQSVLCNYNFVCDGSETYLSCPSDCKWYDNDGICNSISGDNYCDLDCNNDSDCYQANCNNGGLNESICSQPSCNDGIQNGDEEGVDCGGSCWHACPVCGDGIISGDEECENNINLSLSCKDFGFSGGDLSCNNCKFDFSKCESDNPINPFCGDNICQQVSGSPAQLNIFQITYNWILELFGRKSLASPSYTEDCSSCPQDCGECNNNHGTGGGGGSDILNNQTTINNTAENLTSNSSINKIEKQHSEIVKANKSSQSNLISETPKSINTYLYFILGALIIAVLIIILIIRRKIKKKKKIK